MRTQPYPLLHTGFLLVPWTGYGLPTRVICTRAPLISSGQFPLTGNAHASPLLGSLHPLPGRFGFSPLCFRWLVLWVPSHQTLLDKWSERKENGAKTKGLICLQSVPQWITWGDSSWFASNVWGHTPQLPQTYMFSDTYMKTQKEKNFRVIFSSQRTFSSS